MKEYGKAIRINGKESIGYLKTTIFLNENEVPHNVVDNTKFLRRKFTLCNFFCEKFKKKVPHILIKIDEDMKDEFDGLYKRIKNIYKHAHIVENN